MLQFWIFAFSPPPKNNEGEPNPNPAFPVESLFLHLVMWVTSSQTYVVPGNGNPGMSWEQGLAVVS